MMSKPGTETNPLRVAVIGAGPTGFYTAEHLFKQKEWVVDVDMFERLPTPYGLVRGGVAPDHQKIKSVTKVFDRTASHPRFRFFGHVALGRDITLDDLRHHYHQIVYTTGAQTDRALGIPGEDLPGSHAATEFVAWYNGHPDYTDRQFDLSQERVAVVGVGNVAIDVARILARTTDELAQTDIADYALEALSQSKVREIIVLGRRGPAQAAFTNPEIKELGDLAGADVCVLPAEAELDPLSEQALAESNDRAVMKKVDILQAYAAQPPQKKCRQITLRFLVSPVELLGEERITAMRLVKNELVAGENGRLRPRATDAIAEVPVGLVFRSVGYRGVALPGVPFNDGWGIIPNELGRVMNPETQTPVPGEYTAGWIKRGPSGIIGTNKPDALETVNCMLEDLAQDKVLTPAQTAADVEILVRERQPDYFSYSDWLALDELEVSRGLAVGRPRVKFTRVEDMLKALGK